MLKFQNILLSLDELLSEEKIRLDFFNDWFDSGLQNIGSYKCTVNDLEFQLEPLVPIVVVSRHYVSRKHPGYPSARVYAAIGGLVDDLGLESSGMYDSKLFFIELNYNENLELISIYADVNLYAL